MNESAYLDLSWNSDLRGGMLLSDEGGVVESMGESATLPVLPQDEPLVLDDTELVLGLAGGMPGRRFA